MKDITIDFFFEIKAKFYALHNITAKIIKDTLEITEAAPPGDVVVAGAAVVEAFCGRVVLIIGSTVVVVVLVVVGSVTFATFVSFPFCGSWELLGGIVGWVPFPKGSVPFAGTVDSEVWFCAEIIQEKAITSVNVLIK